MSRASCGKRQIKIVKLMKDKNYGFGMVITCGDTYDTVLQGAFIESLSPNSPADYDGNLSPGDQILSVNGQDVQKDNFLDVVDLIKACDSYLELVIAKANGVARGLNATSSLTCRQNEISQPPCAKSITWRTEENCVVSERNCQSHGLKNEEVVSENPPIPKPRKKNSAKLLAEVSISESNLCDAVAKNLHLNSSEVCESSGADRIDCSIISEHLLKTDFSVPDIIPSQIETLDLSLAPGFKDTNTESIVKINQTKDKMADSSFTSSDISFSPCYTEKDVKDCSSGTGIIPGEIYHVVLDKKGGSLGLNIYQGTDSTCSHRRHIYVHSLIPGGAAEIDSRISPGDKLLEVNGVLLQNLSYNDVVKTLRESAQVTHLVLERGHFVMPDVIDDEISNCTQLYSHSHNADSVKQNCNLFFKSPSFEIVPQCKFNASVSCNTKSKRSISLSSNFLSDYFCVAHKGFEIKNARCDNKTHRFNKCTGLLNNSKAAIMNNHLFSHSESNSFNMNLQNNNAKSSMPVSFSANNSISHHILDSTYPVYIRKLNGSSMCALDFASKETSSPPVKDSLWNFSEILGSQHASEKSCTVFGSTPNLNELLHSEENPKQLEMLLYRNKSSDCLFSSDHVDSDSCLLDQYCFMRGSSKNVCPVPKVPIRKKKLRKIEDIYNFCNPENTFYVTIRKSSRGLGLSVSGGTESSKKDPFSQLIHIRKLYPLQPAMECGKIAVGDVILEVNGINMLRKSNTEALEVLRAAAPEVTLKLFRPSKSSIPLFNVYKNYGCSLNLDSLSSSASSSLSRKEGICGDIENKEFNVLLMKREGSLGFTVTRKEENLADGETSGIYVKALIREPAVSDGRVWPGDKIVKVNGVNISSMTHEDAISVLRNAPETVTLTLYRSDPLVSPTGFEDHPIARKLRWEAMVLLNDCTKRKDSNDSSGDRKKLHRNVNKDTSQPSLYSTGSESNSSSSCCGQEHVINDDLSQFSENSESSGLQRNQRPKSLDALNSSDRKRISQDDVNFHRQASVLGASTEQKKADNGVSVKNSSPKNGQTLMRWRGSTLPNAVDTISEKEVLTKHQIVEEDKENNTLHENIPRPDFPASEKKIWVRTIDVSLDRGWHGRLGFSLQNPPFNLEDFNRKLLPAAPEVKAVHPGSLAAKDGRIKVGDRLVEVNSESLLGKSAAESIDILRKTKGVIKMVFCRLTDFP